MKLNQLRDFLAVAESGSIHQAARTLNVSQPALTKSIRQLEKDLGAPLFERSTKGAVLNPLGYTFLARVRLVANELERARDEVGQLLGRGGGRVSLATSGTPSMLFLPSALKQFRRRFPDAQIRIVDGLLPVMLPELRDGQIDFAMAPKPAQSLGKGYLVTPIYANKRAVVGRRLHPLRHARSLAQLVDAHWILTGAAGARDTEFEALFRSHRLPIPRADVLCESLIALVSLLAESDLLALLPEQWVKSPLTSKLLERIPVREEIDAPDICLIRREGLPLTPAAEAFSDALLREAGYSGR
jgi:DNA-binding transcriptional LysR family regulator